MNFFARLFGLGSSSHTQPDIPFGRYSDAYKSDAQQAAFDSSLDLFEKGEYLNAYRSFFEYLKDERFENISFRAENEQITFEFWQGSQRVTGLATAQKVSAESNVARADDLNVGFLRRLMEANFSLKFSRFALSPDNNLCIRFDTRTVDGSPLKLLNAFRELAIHADKQDDLLLDEFKTLQPAEPRTYGDISEAEKEIKYAYLRSEIEGAFATLDSGKPDQNIYPGTYAYMLLAVAFKLDYLIRPEGFMMDALEKIYAAYFAKNNHTPQAKVQQIRREFQKLLDRPQAEFFKEMYRTRSTFGVNPSVPHGTLVTLIEGELPNMEWPTQQGFEALALAVPQYVAGFALFHYAPPKPDRDFLHLFFQVTEASFFRQLGFENQLADEAGRLNKAEILREIKNITKRNQSEFPRLRPDMGQLDFASATLFGKSFLLMLKDLDVTKAE